MLLRVLTITIAGLFSLAAAADIEVIDVSASIGSVDSLMVDQHRKERRDDRREDRDDRQEGRGENRDDRQECRQEEGLVGDDKRECKQDERGEGGDDEVEAEEAEHAAAA